MMTRLILAGIALVSLSAPALAETISLTSDQAAFRALFKELVETNTTLSSGSCTVAAERMAAHLKAAGFSESDLHLFTAAAGSHQ